MISNQSEQEEFDYSCVQHPMSGMRMEYGFNEASADVEFFIAIQDGDIAKMKEKFGMYFYHLFSLFIKNISNSFSCLSSILYFI